MKKLKIILLFSLIFIIIFKLYNYSFEYENKRNITGTITNIKYSTCTTLEVTSLEKFLVYDCNNNKYKYGDKVKVTGEVSIPKNSFNFNYEKYLLSKNIHYIMYAKKIEVLNHSQNVFYIIKNKLNERLDRYKSKEYLKAFITGGTDLVDENVMESYRNNGISHLFAISGMHITLLSSILYFILNSFFKKRTSFIIISLFLIFYIFITNFSKSVIRAVLMFILLNKSLDKIIFLFLIMLAINPFNLYNLGFCYSYIVTFFLICFKDKLKNKNFFSKTITISFIAFLAGAPISMKSFNEINLFSVFLNIIFVPFVSLFIYPFSLLTYVFKLFDEVFNFIMIYFEKLSLFFQNYNFFITLKEISFLGVIIYFVIVFCSLKNKKYYILLIFLFIFHININFFDKNNIVTFLDVNQGDSIFIKNENENILIDVGGNALGESKIAVKKIIPYLKYMGIRKIDYLILSHGDYDHAGEAINLINNFNVEKVIFNCGELNNLEKEIIKVLDKKKIPHYSCIRELNINNKLYFLNSGIYDNENDNSSVIYTKLNGNKFLFMGDAGIEVEESLIKKYNLKNIDVLKVGHHGSKTSSGKHFIDEINPKYSIISVGENNRYGHPNDSVLDNLSDSKIYRTDKDGSIMFEIKNKFNIKTSS